MEAFTCVLRLGVKAVLKAHFSEEASKRPLGHDAAVDSNITRLRKKQVLRRKKKPTFLWQDNPLWKSSRGFPCPQLYVCSLRPLRLLQIWMLHYILKYINQCTWPGVRHACLWNAVLTTNSCMNLTRDLASWVCLLLCVLKLIVPLY